MSRAGHEVTADEAGLRLDRWFRRHFPALSHGRLERLLRTGQIRVDGRRVKSGHRLAPGNLIRVPPVAEVETPVGKPSPPPVSDRDRRALEEMVLYRDAAVLAINKPPGLAVQGGSAVSRHLDAMLDGLRFEAAERPRLVHRLDKDTSGVMLLARTAKAAAAL
ncbi:MAG: pseudouridine synthase, partial [Alphaproteobacteria bacterium]|nr:pseudouridine synthase [Alphaproteobacteria bacterium]